MIVQIVNIPEMQIELSDAMVDIPQSHIESLFSQCSLSCWKGHLGYHISSFFEVLHWLTRK